MFKFLYPSPTDLRLFFALQGNVVSTYIFGFIVFCSVLLLVNHVLVYWRALRPFGRGSILPILNIIMLTIMIFLGSYLCLLSYNGLDPNDHKALFATLEQVLRWPYVVPIFGGYFVIFLFFTLFDPKLFRLPKLLFLSAIVATFFSIVLFGAPVFLEQAVFGGKICLGISCRFRPAQFDYTNRVVMLDAPHKLDPKSNLNTLTMGPRRTNLHKAFTLTYPVGWEYEYKNSKGLQESLYGGRLKISNKLTSVVIDQEVHDGTQVSRVCDPKLATQSARLTDVLVIDESYLTVNTNQVLRRVTKNQIGQTKVNLCNFSKPFLRPSGDYSEFGVIYYDVNSYDPQEIAVLDRIVKSIKELDY